MEEGEDEGTYATRLDSRGYPPNAREPEWKTVTRLRPIHRLPLTRTYHKLNLRCFITLNSIS